MSNHYEAYLTQYDAEVKTYSAALKKGANKMTLHTTPCPEKKEARVF